MQLFSKDAFAFREQFQNLKKVQSICLCGLFVAAYVALSFFSIKMTEFLDVISFFAAPQTGPFFPGFTISYAILGFLFGLILYRAKITPLRAFAAGLAEFIIACTLNTMWLHFMYGMEWEYLFTIRLIKNTVSLGVNSVLLFVFMKAFSRIILTVSPALKASRQ